MSQLDPDRYKRLTGSMTYGQSDGLYFDTVTSKLVLIVNSVVYASSGQLLVGNGTDLVPATVSGDLTISSSGVAAVAAGVLTTSQQAKPRLRIIQDTLLASALTDGGAAVGTKSLAIAVPAGALYLYSTITNIVAFSGNTSAVITLGDGSDVDRYNTGTPSVFATAAAGVAMGVPSGTAFHSAAIANIIATVTSATDITPVLSSGGSAVIQSYFLEPV